MPLYDVVIHCEHCDGEHPLLMRIYLIDVVERKQSVAELFRERVAPPQVSALKGHTALCLKTGKKFKLDQDERVFLVPASLFTSA